MSNGTREQAEAFRRQLEDRRVRIAAAVAAQQQEKHPAPICPECLSERPPRYRRSGSDGNPLLYCAGCDRAWTPARTLLAELDAAINWARAAENWATVG